MNINLKVPFYPQTDNYRDPERTCNSSCCAMCLEFFKPGTLKGPKGDDDYIRKVFAIGDTTDHNIQTKILNNYGIKSEFRYDLSMEDLESQLKLGKPVILGILHRGTLDRPTGGHMICARGINEKGDFIVNDPYGNILDGYTSKVENGNGAIYPRYVIQKRWLPEGPKSGWGRIFK